MLSESDSIEVVGAAETGEELLARWDEWRPEVVTLDLNMPGMGGLATLDRIVERGGPPVIILSTHSGLGAPQTIEALSRGAADFIDKQEYSLLDFSALGAVLSRKILAVAQATKKNSVRKAAPHKELPVKNRDFELLVIGASTGGPPAIEQILSDLGRDCPVPILVVQHMPEGFIQAFAHRLNTHLPLGVFEAQPGVQLQPRMVYIGPSGSHLRVVRGDSGLSLTLSQRPRDHIHRPSVDVLFQSASETTGGKTLAALLTGMGKDGAQGLKAIRKSGGYTVVQDKTSSVVFGMPGAAIKLRAACEVLPIVAMGMRLRSLLNAGHS